MLLITSPQSDIAIAMRWCIGMAFESTSRHEPFVDLTHNSLSSGDEDGLYTSRSVAWELVLQG